MTSPARGGVFSEATDRRVVKFTESISFDQRLYAHDIAASIAHAHMLAFVGLLTAEEAGQIESALREIEQEIETGLFAFSDEREDVHMNVEAVLTERLGDVGRKLHTARSRNDQVSADLRLWCRDAIDRLDRRLIQLQQAWVDRCEADAKIIVPAYTHLQRAQPVLATHYWLAYCEKLERDRGRLADCRRRLNVCSLGAAAVAGTSLPVDREHVAKALGFDEVAANSLDVSSDRDFVLELAFALTMVAEHLGGWAEDWILWSTVEFGFLKLPEKLCTGSSIMPQKINPDVLELIRGKTGRVVGNLMSLLTLIKGLPLAYNRDLQEDKPPLFDSVDTIDCCLELAVPLVVAAELNRDATAARLDQGYLDATTLMEYMIKRGIAQRTAHELVGTLVREAAEHGLPLNQLPLEQFQAAHPLLDEKVYEVLGVENAIQAFVSYGSTAPHEVARQIERWKKKMIGQRVKKRHKR